MQTELQTRPTVSMSMQLSTLGEIRDFCKVLANTTMVPKAYHQKPDDILVAILHGQEVGLPHLQALQSIAVVNGIPSIYGDAALAMVRASGKLEDFDEWIEVAGVRQEGPFAIMSLAEQDVEIVAFCQSKRVRMSRPRTTTYSVRDAKRAGLWGKQGPWTTVGQRMLMFRARGWNLRDNFGDVLKGLAFYEEAMDVTTEQGRDGVYRPLPTVPMTPLADPATEAAELAEMQAKLKALREAPVETKEEPVVNTVQADGLVGDAHALPLTNQLIQDAPAPTTVPGKASNEPIEQALWDEILCHIANDAALNDLKAKWQTEHKVKNPAKMLLIGQRSLLTVMRTQPGFPY